MCDGDFGYYGGFGFGIQLDQLVYQFRFDGEIGLCCIDVVVEGIIEDDVVGDFVKFGCFDFDVVVIDEGGYVVEVDFVGVYVILFDEGFDEVGWSIEVDVGLWLGVFDVVYFD